MLLLKALMRRVGGKARSFVYASVCGIDELVTLDCTPMTLSLNAPCDPKLYYFLYLGTRSRRGNVKGTN